MSVRKNKIERKLWPIKDITKKRYLNGSNQKIFITHHKSYEKSYVSKRKLSNHKIKGYYTRDLKKLWKDTMKISEPVH